jgi:hypothetical protein
MGARRAVVLVSLFASLISLFTSCGAPPDIVSILPESSSTASNVRDARPIKLFFVVGSTQTIALTDPAGARASAAMTLIERQSLESSVLISDFAGNAMRFFMPTFTSLTHATTAQKDEWKQRLLDPNAAANSVDFVTPLRAVTKAIAADLAASGGTPRYEVIFIADTGPTDQDAELLCSPLIADLVALGDVHLNTVMINQADVPSCGASFTSSACAVTASDALCPSSIFSADQERLARLAALGNGTFRAFRHGDRVDFAPLLAH